jgi:hypothetical protein
MAAKAIESKKDMQAECKVANYLAMKLAIIVTELGPRRVPAEQLAGRKHFFD